MTERWPKVVRNPQVRSLQTLYEREVNRELKARRREHAIRLAMKAERTRRWKRNLRGPVSGIAAKGIGQTQKDQQIEQQGAIE